MKIPNRLLDDLSRGELDNLERGEKFRFMKSVMDRTKISIKHSGDLWDNLREQFGFSRTESERR